MRWRVGPFVTCKALYAHRLLELIAILLGEAGGFWRGSWWCTGVDGTSWLSLRHSSGRLTKQLAMQDWGVNENCMFRQGRWRWKWFIDSWPCNRCHLVYCGFNKDISSVMFWALKFQRLLFFFNLESSLHCVRGKNGNLCVSALPFVVLGQSQWCVFVLNHAGWKTNSKWSISQAVNPIHSEYPFLVLKVTIQLIHEYIFLVKS